MGGECGNVWEAREVLKGFLVGRPGGKRPPGGPMHRWEDNIRMDIQEMRWRDMDWIYLIRRGTSGSLL
jgi:hypothetical protein